MHLLTKGEYVFYDTQFEIMWRDYNRMKEEAKK